jgi:GNAT superfamily N-acetyltransferase
MAVLAQKHSINYAKVNILRFAIPGGCDTIAVARFMNRVANLSIRPITPNDEPFLWDMLYQAIFVPANQPKPDRNIVEQPELAKYVQGWGRQHDSGFLAFATATRQPVGAVWSRLFTGSERGYGYVDEQTPELSIAILPEYRGEGIGTKLLTRLLESFPGKYPALSLSVDQNNPALKLYRRTGFEVVKRVGTTFVMKKTLKF